MDTTTRETLLARMIDELNTARLTGTEHRALAPALRELDHAYRRLLELRELVRPVADDELDGNELRWDGSEYHTGVTATPYDGRYIQITRCGKGDSLVFDAVDARRGLVAVRNLSTGELVGWVGDNRTGDSGRVFVGLSSSHGVDESECDNMPTAIVALAFAHIV